MKPFEGVFGRLAPDPKLAEATLRRVVEGCSVLRSDESRRREIAALLLDANERAHQAMREDDPRYWYWRCRALEIGWVANVLSNILVANGMLPIGDMTAHGRLKAAEIIGVEADHG